MKITKYDMLSVLEGLFTIGGLVVSALIFKEESAQDDERMSEAKAELKAYVDDRMNQKQNNS